MASTETAVVHNFKKWNIAEDEYEVSRFKATAEAVERAGSEIIGGTAETVDASLLDDTGRYRPDGASP